MSQLPKFLPGHKSRASSEAPLPAPSSGAVAGFKEGIQSPAPQQIFIFIESVKSQLSHRHPPLSQPGKSHGCIQGIHSIPEARGDSSLPQPFQQLIPRPAASCRTPPSRAWGGRGQQTPRRSLEKATRLGVEAIQFLILTSHLQTPLVFPLFWMAKFKYHTCDSALGGVGRKKK